MKTTEKRMTISFTREQLREIEILSENMGEPQSAVIHRAVSLLYWHYFEFTQKKQRNLPNST